MQAKDDGAGDAVLGIYTLNGMRLCQLKLEALIQYSRVRVRDFIWR